MNFINLIYSQRCGGFTRDGKLVVPADLGLEAEPWEFSLALLTLGESTYESVHKKIQTRLVK
jgi:hypothetical protein